MRTELSPEWDRDFDAAFTDLVSHDDELVRTEFTGLVSQAWPVAPEPWRHEHGEHGADH